MRPRTAAGVAALVAPLARSARPGAPPPGPRPIPPRTAAGGAPPVPLPPRPAGAAPPPPADPPKSPAARKAEETFRAELAHLDEAYRRDLKAVTDRYVKELDQA